MIKTYKENAILLMNPIKKLGGKETSAKLIWEIKERCNPP
jgi:hypothetical protein